MKQLPFDHLLHGGDYNPDQWLDRPDVLAEDIRLMRKAKVNVVSLGIFAWVAMEPEEGRFEFGWLDETIDRLGSAGIDVFLATPTGARPAWMSAKYPEVLRVGPNRVRNLHGARHNHCYTSPLYREKTKAINTKLADRYAARPNVVLWHLSNEYGGECHCPLCQDAFRSWLRERYRDDLDALNRSWWTAFWSHTYTSWDQVESPAPHGERSVHGLNLDWKRFVTHQTVDFMRHEIDSIRSVTSEVPVTTNLMGYFPPLDYFKLAPHLDIVSWDSYPAWGGSGTIPGARAKWDSEGRDWRLAADVGTQHDLMRSCGGGKPFLLMESTPSMTNWQDVSRLKRPGMHLASSLLAVAHGSDSVQYFQWRKSRGSSEKFHGAVVDHAGHEDTRVFGDVTEVGEALERLREVAGSGYVADAAVIYDWENMWAINDAQGPIRTERRAYIETVERHAFALSRLTVGVDVIDSEQPFDRYTLLVAPMLYMVKPGVAERVERFVRGGGTFVATYWSGIVDEHDLCFEGGFPGPLSGVLGIWSEEIDALYPDERVEVQVGVNGLTGTNGSGGTDRPGGTGGPARYSAHELCDLIHLRGAQALAHYASEFYAGRPALTVNRLGSGRAFYIASRNEQRFLDDFYDELSREIRPARACETPLAEVHATTRRRVDADGSTTTYRFYLNFSPRPQPVPAPRTNEAVIYRSPERPAARAATGASAGTAAEAGVAGPGEAILPPLGIEVRRD